MAIQEHPKYAEWEKALDDFREALANYESKQTVAAWLDLQKAIAVLDKVGREIDNDARVMRIAAGEEE